MENNDLQEKIAKSLVDGYTYLGKSVDEALTIEDIKILANEGKMDSFHAYHVNGAIWFAEQNGKKLSIESKYLDVLDALNVFSERDELREAATDFLTSVYHFLPRQRQKEMENDINYHLQHGNPHAFRILVALLKMPYNDFSPQENITS